MQNHMESAQRNPHTARAARVVYNPYILQWLYQRVIYRAKLEQILTYRSNTIKGEDRETIVRENFQDLSIVSELVFLLTKVREQKFQFDVTECCFERILFQAFVLFFPKKRLLQEDLCRFNDDPLFSCEDSLLLLLTKIGEGEEKNRETLTEVILDFLETHYSYNQSDYQRKSKERVALFFHMKESVEEKMGLSEETVIEYGGEQIATLLYLCVLNELLTLLEWKQSTSLHKVQTKPYPSEDERLVEERALMDTMEKDEKNVILLRLFYDGLLEFHLRNLSLNLFDSPIHEKELRTFVKGEEKYRMVRKGKEFLLVPKSTHHLLYLKLSRDQHQYQYVVRRFLFDYQLRLSHEKLCFSDGCRLCHYFTSDSAQKSNRNLNDFYTIVEGGQKEKCQVFLESFIMDRLEALDSLVFKNGWQLLKLINPRLPLFYLVGVSEMVGYVKSHYEQCEGEGQYRLGLILMTTKSKVKSGNAFRTEKWQEDLALDQDVFQLMFGAILSQIKDLTKHARALLSQYNTDTLGTELNAELSEIFLLYDRVLRLTMK